MERRRPQQHVIAILLAGLLVCGIVSVGQSANMSSTQVKMLALESKRKTDEGLRIQALEAEVRELKSQKKEWADAKARMEAKMKAQDVLNDQILQYVKPK